MSDSTPGDKRMTFNTPAGRPLTVRRLITLNDDQEEIFYTDDGTGYPRFGEDGVVLNYFHTDGRPATFRQTDIKRFEALG